MTARPLTPTESAALMAALTELRYAIITGADLGDALDRAEAAIQKACPWYDRAERATILVDTAKCAEADRDAAFDELIVKANPGLERVH